MPRNVTVTLEDGSTYTYQGVPDDATPDIVNQRAQQQFGKAVTRIDGGRTPAPPDTMALPTAADAQAAPEAAPYANFIPPSLKAAGSFVAEGVQRLPATLAEGGVTAMNKLIGGETDLSSVRQQAAQAGGMQNYLLNRLPELTPEQKQQQQQYPIVTGVAEAVPSMAIPVEGALAPVAAVAKGLKGAATVSKLTPAVIKSIITKVAPAAVSGAAGSQLAYQTDPNADQGEQAAYGAGFGAAVATAGVAGKALAKSNAAKYIPGVNKRQLAAKDIQTASGRPEEQTANLVNQWKTRLDKGQFLTQGEMYGDAQLRNMESSYMASMPPEVQAVYKKRLQDRAVYLNGKAADLIKNLNISPEEAQKVQQVYGSLADIALKPEDFRAIMNNPKFQDIYQSVVGEKKNVDLARMLQGVEPNSVAFADTIKRQIDSRLYGKGELDYAETKALKDLRGLLVAASDRAATSEGQKVSYETARQWSQREIIANQLDEAFAKAPVTNVNGKLTVSPGGLKQVFSGVKYNKIEDSLSTISDKKVRAQAMANARELRNIVLSADSGHLEKMMGLEDTGVQMGGVYSTSARAVGNFARGEYNKQMMELLTDPVAHQKELEAIKKLPKVDKLPALVRLLDTSYQNVVRNERQAATDIPLSP